ncbi:Pyruvate dehydrogenase E1 component subunit alpha, mitochondrial [Bifiguratus adelaidae]|uniref:Pyruvate dehydrogenase E1 component subunit alpha n=1 Tax=Bifiguratus adelaidae TaxID=1938954 RepID=A0A261XU06_9FUNG|nr:Pyruvate dehydrogenase E1 component subunit alpha, mitochondrial [Bifiguratus adelaidae]
MLRSVSARVLAHTKTQPVTGAAFRAFAANQVRGYASTADIPEDTVSITLPENSFDTYKCDKPSLEVQISKKEMVQMYTDMVAMRRMEMAADALYKSKFIRGFCHLCTGQEAVSVGMEHAITRADQIITAYRCHGFTMMRGATVKQVIAELLGRKDGISRGMGGSMHMFARSFFGGNGIVGAQVPLGAGIAFAQKYMNNPSVTFALYGDGASNQGQVFEAYNMAKLWDLPCVFVCENNRYGMGTSAARSSASTKYYTRGDYIPGIVVNGMDVLAVKQACAWAKEWTTSGKGPLVMEMSTYRYGGHSMSDPGTTYRTREEIQHMRSTSDPITGLKQRLLELDIISEADLKDIDKQARKSVDEAVAAAKESPEPNTDVLFQWIYQKGTEPKMIRGREPSENHYFSQ